MAAAVTNVVSDGDTIWVKHPTKVWCSATVTTVNARENKLYATTDEGESVVIPLNDVTEAMINDLQGVDDLLSLDNMHEASVLHTLRKRHRLKKPYTWIGPIMVFVNPYTTAGQPDDSKLLESTLNAGFQPIGASSPHIYALASAVYRDMVETSKSQSVLITGESGAGKTSMARMLLRYMAQASAQKANVPDLSLDVDDDRFNPEVSLEDRIVSAGPVMEAFGNAQTVRNKNSSRFGKYLKVYFSASGKTQGANITIYLLEKARVINQDKGERNYHIFYQYLATASLAERKEFRLKPASEFAFLNKSGTGIVTIDGVNDREEYIKVLESFDLLGITFQEVSSIHRILAALLHLGNIRFVSDGVTDGCMIEDDKNLDNDLRNMIASQPVNNQGPQSEGFVMSSVLLRCEMSSLHAALTIRHIKSTGKSQSTYGIPLTPIQATENRDSLVKSLYGLLFQWLVNRINLVIDIEGRKTASPVFIGILDIFGFEIFDKNRFDQLCINYCNERLQQYFNKNVFQIEQMECMSEGVQLTMVNYLDNSECVKLIDDTPKSILSCLQEEGLLPKGTDFTFLGKLQEQFGKNPYFKKLDPRRSQNEFCIAHYAGDVAYDVNGFLDRNKSAMNPDLLELMESSADAFVSDLFITHRVSQASGKYGSTRSIQSVSSVTSSMSAEDSSMDSPLLAGRKQSRGTSQHTPRSSFLKNAQTQSVSAQFRDQLNFLMSNINQTNAYFVRCLCSNYVQEPGSFESSVMLNQLRCAGILDCVRIRMLGYPIRRTYKDFRGRYASLMKKPLTNNPVDDVKLFFQTLDYPSKTSLYQFGKTKVFLNDKISRLLETRRAMILNAIVVPIQRAYRMYADRQCFKDQKRAAIVLQAAILKKLATKKTMDQLQAIRVLQAAIRFKQAKARMVVLLEQAQERTRRAREQEEKRLRLEEERRKEEERLREEEEERKREEERQKAEEKLREDVKRKEEEGVSRKSKMKKSNSTELDGNATDEDLRRKPSRGAEFRKSAVDIITRKTKRQSKETDPSLNASAESLALLQQNGAKDSKPIKKSRSLFEVPTGSASADNIQQLQQESDDLDEQTTVRLKDESAMTTQSMSALSVGDKKTAKKQRPNSILGLSKIADEVLPAGAIVDDINDQFRSELEKLKLERDRSANDVNDGSKELKRKKSTLKEAAKFKVLDHAPYVGKPDVEYNDEDHLTVEFYRTKMLPNQHLEYIAAESPEGPVSLSIMFKDEDTNPGQVECHVILRTHEQLKHLTLHVDKIVQCCSKPKNPTPNQVFEIAGLGRLIPHLKLFPDPALSDALLKMDERQLNVNYKFGVLLAKHGQTLEEEFFANIGIEGKFQQFLDDIGDRVQLKGWTKYRAGLDIKGDITGTHSYYTAWHDHEIMYHVANCIPFNPADPQQLERKRQIGNDIVIVVFCEDLNAVESIKIFRSHQNHVVFTVHRVGEDYLVRCMAKADVPAFQPEFPPEGFILRKNSFFRELFVHLLANAERASYKAPVFASRITRTRTMLMADLVNTYAGKAKK